MMQAKEAINRLQNICREQTTLRDASNNRIAILARNRNIEALNFAISTLESVLHGHE